MIVIYNNSDIYLFCMIYIFSIFFSLLTTFPNSVFAQDIKHVAQKSTAQKLFSHLSPALYQIKIIDELSGYKKSIGSGFVISQDGLVVTNYHVVSAAALHPDKHRIEFENNNGDYGQLELLSVDVINDLAILKQNTHPPANYFRISPNDPSIGEQVFSLGNPHDLGMIISPGTYNGIKKDSLYNRVHFTGSVNSGMSGGPVVNSNEQVIGINVATGGNSIGFLVTRSALIDLIEQLESDLKLSIKEQIYSRLHANQSTVVDRILSIDWNQQQLGSSLVPSQIAPFFKCWGNSNKISEDSLYNMAYARCGLRENIYIDSDFTTGSIAMEFFTYEGKDLRTRHFYNLVSKAFSSAGADNKSSEEHTSNYKCMDDIVSVSTKNTLSTKAIFCSRAYKDYEGLYDILFSQASLFDDQQSLISHFTLSGVTKEKSLEFTKRFMKEIQWQ